MKWKPLVALALLSGGGYAAYRYFKRQAGLLQQYQIEPIGASVVTATKDLLVMDFVLRLTNKSAIEATITQMYADVFLNNTLAGSVASQGSVLVPAKGQSDVRVRLSAQNAEILKGIVSLITVIATIGDVPYRLKGYANIKSSFVTVSVPFDADGMLKRDLLGKTS